METLPSRAWSCSELLDGAAMLTDDAVVAYKKNLLSETHGKSVEELERLLQDWGGCLFDSCQKHTVGHFEDTDAAIAEHPGAHELDSFVP